MFVTEMNDKTEIIVQQPTYDQVPIYSNSNEHENGSLQSIYEPVPIAKEFQLQNHLKSTNLVSLVLIERKCLNDIYSWTIGLRNGAGDTFSMAVLGEDGKCTVVCTDSYEIDFRLNLLLLNCDLHSSEIGTCRRRDFTVFAKLFKDNQKLILKSPSNDDTIGVLGWSDSSCEPFFLSCPSMFGSDIMEQEFQTQNSTISNIKQSLFVKLRHRRPFPGPQVYNEVMATINFKDFCKTKPRLMSLIALIASNAIGCLKFYNPKFI